MEYSVEDRRSPSVRDAESTVWYSFAACQVGVSCLGRASGGERLTFFKDLHSTWLWVPFWGRCTTHFRTYFSGDSDVHWG